VQRNFYYSYHGMDSTVRWGNNDMQGHNPY
jgi:hypothetical protein